MAGNITYTNAINSCAIQCAMHRRNKVCKDTFGSYACNDCRHYIGRYIDADPRQLELYMYQTEINTDLMVQSSFYARLHNFIVLAFIVCILWFCWWGLTLPKRNAEKRARYNTVQQTSVVNNTSAQSTHQMIEAALWAVSRDLNNKRDMTGNGKSNCEDAAILFYMYYPDKDNVRIYANDNDATNMRHAFNIVLIDGVWRAIEPQAYHLGWQSHGTYFMRDIWGSVYDHTKNKDAWNDYGRFVR